MCYDDYECDDISSEWRRAKKEHRCFACKETIRPGDAYRSTVQKYDSELSQFKHCARCWAMAQAILKKNGSVQWDLNCGESWRENFGEVPEPIAALAFLTPDEAQALPRTDTDFSRVRHRG